jgi:hypothetical protein
LPLLWVLAGCQQSTNPLKVMPSLTSAPSVTPSRTPKSSPTSSINPTTSSITTPTTAPSSSPTKSNTPTVAPSPTVIVPTKSREGQNEFFLARLKQEPGCQLPCWWNTQPGETKWNTVESDFLQNGIEPQKYNASYELGWREIPLRDKLIGFGITYYLRSIANPVVDAISLGAQMSNKNSLIWNNELYDLFPSFRLDKILSTLGKPESVKIYTSGVGNENGQIFYNLVLRYPSIGVSVLYEGIASTRGDNLLVCPDNTSFNIYLWDPEKSDQSVVINGIFSSFIPAEYLNFYEDLNKVTKLTIDDFFATYSQANNHTCISTPLKNWIQ